MTFVADHTDQSYIPLIAYPLCGQTLRGALQGFPGMRQPQNQLILRWLAGKAPNSQRQFSQSYVC